MDGDGAEIAVLLSLSTVASFVFPNHVLDGLHVQYTLVHFNLYLREGAEYDLVVFLGELTLDNVLGPAPTQLLHPSLRWDTTTVTRDSPSQKIQRQ